MPPPKRTAVSTDSAPHKKTRFLSPTDDPTHFADQVDSALESSSTHKRRVNTDGYDSDSSDDGEGVVNSRKPGAARDNDEEDHDMFAIPDDDDKDKAAGSSTKKKNKDEFLRLGDIEGQEFNNRSDEEDNDDDHSSSSPSSENEPEDDDDAERRKKAGMGFELSSFNMREEMEEGKFAADGTFVKTFDPHAMHDRWMEGTSAREIARARRAKKVQARAERERRRAEAREADRLGAGRDAMERALVPMLKKGESVLEALARLGSAHAKQKDKKSRPKARAGESSIQADPSPDPQTSQIEQITALASNLMAAGDADIYSKTYEHLLRSIRAAGAVSPTWTPPSADVKYEYKWAVAPASPDAEQQVFGPFGEEDMKAWHNALYFGTGGEKVVVRRVGGDWGAWDDVVE